MYNSTENEVKEINRYINTIGVRVNFFGLRGTTRDMQEQGWELSVSQNYNNHTGEHFFYLAGKHEEMKMHLYSTSLVVNRDAIHTAFGGGGNLYCPPNGLKMLLHSLTFEVRACAEHISITMMDQPSMAQPVDFRRDCFNATPLYSNTKRMEDMCVFIPFKRSNELFVPKDKIVTIREHLEETLILQSGRQKEIRERIMKERSKNMKRDNYKDSPNLIGTTQLTLVAV